MKRDNFKTDIEKNNINEQGRIGCPECTWYTIDGEIKLTSDIFHNNLNSYIGYNYPESTWNKQKKTENNFKKNTTNIISIGRETMIKTHLKPFPYNSKKDYFAKAIDYLVQKSSTILNYK